MSTVGQREILTQRRVVDFFTDTLGYVYLGDWNERVGNRNIEWELVAAWLERQGHEAPVITKVLDQVDKTRSARWRCDSLRCQPGASQPPALRREGSTGGRRGRPRPSG